jgi:GDPmannose 4,6-dehydratase
MVGSAIVQALQKQGETNIDTRTHAELNLTNQVSVRQFISWSAEELGITLTFAGQGVGETATVAAISGDKAPGVKVGDVQLRIDPRYFRPTEVETLFGDPAKAQSKLGWMPEIIVQQMCAEMVAADLEEAWKQSLLKKHGFQATLSVE